jgi:hypothetical protein
LSLHATFVRSDPGRGRSFGVEPADHRRAGVGDRYPYAEPAGIERDNFVDRVGVWMRSHVRLSIELVFANHALATVDLGFDMVLQDAFGFGEPLHDRISAAGACIGVATGREPDTLPD